MAGSTTFHTTMAKALAAHTTLAGSTTFHMTIRRRRVRLIRRWQSHVSYDAGGALAAHMARRILWDRMFHGLFQA